MTIGQKIKQLRKQRGLTQARLGQEIFYSQRTVFQWEHGKCEPSLRAAKALCKFFNITFEELMKGVDD